MAKEDKDKELSEKIDEFCLRIVKGLMWDSLEDKQFYINNAEAIEKRLREWSEN
tara:strand:- start:455 stop:616 length:162 start_codon:yes stop_codon:yes gene_type:complete